MLLLSCSNSLAGLAFVGTTWNLVLEVPPSDDGIWLSSMNWLSSSRLISLNAAAWLAGIRLITSLKTGVRTHGRPAIKICLDDNGNLSRKLVMNFNVDCIIKRMAMEARGDNGKLVSVKWRLRGDYHGWLGRKHSISAHKQAVARSASVLKLMASH